MKKPMDVYFHGEREGGLWRGQVIGTSGALKARTGNLFNNQAQAEQAARRLWHSLQQQLRAVAS